MISYSGCNAHRMILNFFMKTCDLRVKSRLNSEKPILKDMKLIWTVLLLVASVTGYTQEGELPSSVKSAFDTKYPATKISDWWLENELYYLDFNFKGGSFIAIFSGQGSWLETAETISELDIPGDVNAYIRSHCPSGRISFCEKVETPERRLYLRVTLIDAENVYRVLSADLQGKNIVLEEPNPL